MTSLNAGICAIKEEFVLKKAHKSGELSATSKRKNSDNDNTADTSDTKKARNDDNEGGHNKLKVKNRGQNKARPKTYREDKQSKPCPSIIDVTSAEELKSCTYSNCQFIHNSVDYLQSKPKDIGPTCYVYDLRGRCPRGLTCRFGAEHISAEGYNIIDKEKHKNWQDDTKNTIQPTLQTQLQKRKYDLSLAERLVRSLDTRNKNNSTTKTTLQNDEPINAIMKSDKNILNKETDIKPAIDLIADEDLIKLLPREKRSIDWKDKLYLSPLTTVGNLPFRRICKEFGVDITCGEMALCESLLKGHKQEWALVKKHKSEDLFGAQICGNNVYTITKVAQLLQENTELDFIDLNLGCPIDLIYKQGGGSGMMHRQTVLETSVRCASTLLSIPFTVKMRTGVYQNKKIAHKLIPEVIKSGASLITLHGRSREGRYTRSADWEYIESCAKDVAPFPIFGNGDIMSYEDYIQKREMAPSVQGVMIGRGALIKPWIFTEIKEQRLWDIRSNERFEILKRYTNYGLEHWGSDTQGVENTRRFLLEWLSFLYRYVPVGLLQHPPQKINERPPSYFGRDDLETIMASGNCADWVKISEMLLGPVPDGFNFLPKHKANSYQ